MDIFDSLAREIHEWSQSKGFYDREFVVGIENPSLASEKLMLIVTECSEVMEALRDDDYQHEGEEVSDVMIRLLDYAAWRGISLDREVDLKMAKNRVRPHLHGRQF